MTSIILLAAGKGSRMEGLTKNLPKCMLPINDETAVLDTQLRSFITNDLVTEIVIVCGYEAERLMVYVDSLYGKNKKIKFVMNEQYENDTNIFSTFLGVSALTNKDAGYLIVETDILIRPNSWEYIINEAYKDEHCFWVISKDYSPSLTGGIVKVDNKLNILDITYQPEYHCAYIGWKKLLGILYINSKSVANDITTRDFAIKNTISQYYMQPWIDNKVDIESKALDLGSDFAASFNTEFDFMAAIAEYNRGI